MNTPPYLRKEELQENMSRRPSIGFFLKDGDYRVVDGDTIAVLAGLNAQGKRGVAFKIRLNSVNTPEMPTSLPQQKILRELGLDPHSGHPGAESARAVRGLCKGRAIYVEPAKGQDGRVTDRYGRLLGAICISGSKEKLFDARGAVPLENWLIETGHGHQMEGRPPPPGIPPVITRLAKELRYAQSMERISSGPGPQEADSPRI